MKTDINGKLINSFEDYRNFIAIRHTKEWLKCTEIKIYHVFGKPKKYPFIFIELDKDYEDSAYCSTELCKVYF